MKFTGYIGTYTKGNSKGIYKFTFDSTMKKLSEAIPVVELGNPTYLTASSDKKFLFAVAKDGENGGVASYAINGETGDLTFLSKQLLEGASPCHVNYDQQKQLVISANYHKGTVQANPVLSDGTLKPASSVIFHKGAGPNKERQEKAHTHFSGFTLDGKYIVAVDLGIDKIFTYTYDGAGQLHESSSLSVKPGSGPRHLAFHPNGKWAYVMTELSNEVIFLKYDQKSGSFQAEQYISAIPEDFTENSQGSAIHLSSDGRFVYAANRGHDSIVLFAVHPETGELTFVEHTYTEGHWPRDFILDPSEEFLIATNQESGNLVLFSRDVQSGKLQLLQKDVQVPDPVCVKFL
ncbi:lactonase family protein [Bacillaceae bacterium Marseille-Q3522]|nr:lactonase family protein [Bacillaceae bacterium Marseille-Q3522]